MKTRHGDLDGDSSIDIHDPLFILGGISARRDADSCDLDNDGRTGIGDLLGFLRNYSLLRRMPETGFEAAVVVEDERTAWLADGRVSCFLRFGENGGVRLPYRITGSRELAGVELVFGDDTLTTAEGLTPVFFEADPDTVGWQGKTSIPAPPVKWKLTARDSRGNTVADSGEAVFDVVRPGLVVDGGTPHTGDRIGFPLVLRGAWQRFGIRINGLGGEDTFVVDLNPAGEDSVVFGGIAELAGAVMEQVAAQDSLWRATDPFGGGEPLLFVSAAVSVLTGETAARLTVVHGAVGMDPVVAPLDGNLMLTALLGFPRWRVQGGSPVAVSGFMLDQAVREQYGDR